MSFCNNDKIIKFCNDLKSFTRGTYHNGKTEVTEMKVSHFNTELFTSVVSPTSPNHDPSLCHFTTLSLHLFIPTEIWRDCNLVKDVCDLIAKFEGWQPLTKKRKTTCNRSGTYRLRSKDGQG